MGFVTVRKLPRRTFRITVGLREGYHPEGRVHDPGAAARITAEWISDEAAAGRTPLSAMVTGGTVIYGGGTGGAAQEPVATVSGEVIGTPAEALSDAAVVERLDALAERLAGALGQREVIVAFVGTSWILRSPD